MIFPVNAQLPVAPLRITLLSLAKRVKPYLVRVHIPAESSPSVVY